MGANITTDLPPADIQPWVAALSRRRLEEFGKDDPEITGCKPGGPRHITRAGLAKIVQTPGLMVILYEDLAYRQIFLDGRQLPRDPNPDWMGYSVGHWEGDTLVVESAGFNDRTWLDFAGHGHTEALRMTERYRRRDFGHLDLQVTLDDPQAYAKPWTVSAGGTLAADTELLEYVCLENEKDQQHLIGRTSEEKKVTVSPEILAQYVGVYEVGSAECLRHSRAAQRFHHHAGERRAPDRPAGQRESAHDPAFRDHVLAPAAGDVSIRQERAGRRDPHAGALGRGSAHGCPKALTCPPPCE